LNFYFTSGDFIAVKCSHSWDHNFQLGGSYFNCSSLVDVIGHPRCWLVIRSWPPELLLVCPSF